MSTLYSVGRLANLLARALSVTVTNGTGSPTFGSASDYPLAGLYDGVPLNPWRAGAVFNSSSGIAIAADMQAVINGDFESALVGGLPAAATAYGSWSLENSAAVALDAVNPDTGTNALLVQNGNTSKAVYNLKVQAGEYWRLISLRMRQKTAGGARLTRARILIRELGLFLNPDGTWSTTSVDIQTNSTNTYNGATPVTFQVPDYAAAGFRAELTLAIELFSTSGNGSLFDNIVLVPGVNFVSVHGHNLQSRNSINVYSDPASNFGTFNVEGSMTMNAPSFYRYFTTMFFQRYVQVLFNDLYAAQYSSDVTLTLGELFVGQATTMARPTAVGSGSGDWGPSHRERASWNVKYDRAQVRQETGAGDVYVYNKSSAPRRTLTLPYDGDATWIRDFVGLVRARCEDGLYPLVIVPDSSLPDVVFGRAVTPHEVDQILTSWNVTTLVIEESAFPQMTY